MHARAQPAEVHIIFFPSSMVHNKAEVSDSWALYCLRSNKAWPEAKGQFRHTATRYNKLTYFVWCLDLPKVDALIGSQTVNKLRSLREACLR